MRQTYTDAERDLALLTLVLAGRNCHEAARRLKAQGLTVHQRVLNNWKHAHADRMEELARDAAPQIEQAMMNASHAIAVRANAVTMDAIEAAAKQLEDGDARDPSTVARNLGVVTGIHVDKGLLLAGRPTQITGHADLDSMVSQMGQLLGFDVNSTAEEISTADEITEAAELPPAA